MYSIHPVLLAHFDNIGDYLYIHFNNKFFCCTCILSTYSTCTVFYWILHMTHACDIERFYN